MSKFLIDENLPPSLAHYLRSLGFDAKSVKESGLVGETDDTLLSWARLHNHVIITQDLGFGLVFTQTSSKIGTILLRSKTGTTEIFKKIIKKLSEGGYLHTRIVAGQLIVATEKKIRVLPTLEQNKSS